MPTHDELLNRLDPQQRHVANWTPADGNLKVIASAGSGKTTTLVALTSNLIVNQTVDPSKLVVVTFTKKAGEELRKRLGQVLTPAALNAVRVGTYHALALQTLRNDDAKKWNISRCVEVGSARATGVPSAYELWKSICSYGKVPGSGKESLQLPLDYGVYRREIERWRAHGAECFAEADIPATMRSAEAEDFESAWEYYTEAKTLLNVWDFADLLEAWRAKLREESGQGCVVLVDEAQDNNTVQLDIVRELARDGGRVCLIGDGKQAIYKFRGASPELFQDAESVFRAERREIATNYRSKPHIVAFANDFIVDKAWNQSAPSHANREAESDAYVRRILGSGPHQEADQIAAQIADGIVEEGKRPGDYAILTRTNAARMAFETALIARNIPVVVLGSSSAFSSREAKIVLAYCTLSAFDHIDSLDAILNTPKRYIPRSFISELHTSMSRGRGLLEAYDHAAMNSKMKPGSKRGAGELRARLRELRATPWAEVPDKVRTILRPWLDEQTNDEDEDRTALIESICGLAAMFPDAKTMVEFAERCVNGTQARSEGDDPGNCVTVSTVHKVKGLEWPNVYVSAPGNLLPHARTNSMAEEERLYYVAITRAQDELTVTGNEAEGGVTAFFPRDN